ncbi:hypothetical protein V2J09_011716 [Rumex salicifolius]
MSFSLTNLSWWWLKGKEKEAKLQNGASLSPATELNLWESEALKFSLRFGGKSRSSKPRRVKRKLQEQKIESIDREHDVVIVPSDGGCISDSDSDASDWSIGWSEPHAPDFLSDDEECDGGFGVLVPCYGSKNRDALQGKREFVDSKVNAADRFSADSRRINNPTFAAIDQFVSAEKTNYEQVSCFEQVSYMS